MSGDERMEEVGELIARAWRLVDLAEDRVRDESLEENERIRWAGVLAAVIGTLNKLMWKAGVGRLDKKSVAKLLEKVPKKYRNIVLRVGKGRKRFVVDEQ